MTREGQRIVRLMRYLTPRMLPVDSFLRYCMCWFLLERKDLGALTRTV
jgi:hypothetical protein